jgi:hypothetical protein
MFMTSNYAIQDAYKALRNGEPEASNGIAEVIGTNQDMVKMTLTETVATSQGC